MEPHQWAYSERRERYLKRYVKRGLCEKDQRDCAFLGFNNLKKDINVRDSIEAIVLWLVLVSMVSNQT